MFQTIEICPYVRDVLRKRHVSIVEDKKKSIVKIISYGENQLQSTYMLCW